MSTGSQHDDPGHDEYLRAALRHAPDHGLTPPSSVTQTIFAAARQMHRPVRKTVAPAPIRATIAGQPRWRQILRLLGSPRWAGGFATGLVAALVVGLWIDNDLPVPVSAPPDATRVIAARRDGAPEPAAAVANTAEPRAGAVAEASREAAPPAARPTPARKAIAPAPATPAPTPPSGTQGAGGMTAERDTHAAPAVQTPPLAESRSKLESAHPASIEPSRQADAAAESKQDALGKAAVAGDQRMRMAAPRAETAVEGAAQAAASPALTLLRHIRAESTAQSAQWTWQPPGATAPRPVDADAQAWLLRLVQSARGRWADVAVPSDPGAATEVRWWRDGQPHARLRIESAGLRWLEPSGRIRFAPMEPSALEPLRSF